MLLMGSSLCKMFIWKKQTNKQTKKNEIFIQKAKLKNLSVNYCSTWTTWLYTCIFQWAERCNSKLWTCILMAYLRPSVMYSDVFSVGLPRQAREKRSHWENTMHEGSVDSFRFKLSTLRLKGPTITPFPTLGPTLLGQSWSQHAGLGPDLNLTILASWRKKTEVTRSQWYTIMQDTPFP